MYDVDGRSLCLLDKEDFDNMGIVNRVHIRRIRVELEKIYKNKERLLISSAHEFRREQIRRKKQFDKSVIIIQRQYRRHLAVKEVRLRRDIRRVMLIQRESEEALRRMGIWWTERSDIPSKAMVLKEVDELMAEEEARLLDDMDDVIGITANTNTNTTKGKGKDVNKKDVHVLKLPMIKNFGRHQDHLTCQGWGRRSANGVWKPLTVSG